MKELSKLILELKAEAQKYNNYSFEAKKDVDKAYFDGIAEGIEKAVKEIEKANEVINSKIKELF